jgi:hypothetical protein
VRKVLLAVLAALAAVPAASAAKPVPPPAVVWAPGVEVSYTETVRDGLGRVVSQSHREGIPAGQGFGSAVVTGSSLADATSVDPGSNLASAGQRRLSGRLSCCSSSGSDTVAIAVTKRTLLGFVAWRYHQVDHWCWSYPSITCMSAGAGFYDVDSQQKVNYDNNGYGWYYGWAGSGTGGHYAYRSGSISNCVLKWGCLSTSYPYAEIWLNGNGAWTGDGGGN